MAVGTKLTCRVCNHFVGYAPGKQVCIGTAERAPRVPDERGLLWVRCTDKSCKTWNCFETVAIEEAA